LATLTIAEGQFRGWLLRAGGVRGAQARMDQPGARWMPAPLRLLARHYAADSAVWAWLREHGVRRPSPSGPSGPSVPRAERTRRAIEVTLSDEARARLAELAEARGVSRSELVEALVMGAK
jgi:hypothetical protein